jgi:uncharacterized protein YjcR
MTAKILSTAKNLYPHLPNGEIADLVGISPSTIVGWAKKYGWKKSEAYFETYREPSSRKRAVRENEVEHYDYWELVKQYKEETPIRRFNHPFFEATKKIYKQNQNGTD